jgi:hypothetical protein
VCVVQHQRAPVQVCRLSTNIIVDTGINGAKQLGVFAMPLFDFCDIDSILPNVLHEKINTGNDLIGCIRSYTDRRIEMVTPEESTARTEALAAEIALDECKATIEEYSFAIQAMNITIGEL